MNAYLNRRTYNLIKRIAASDEGILDQFIPGGWWIGEDRVDAQAAWQLLRLCLLRSESLNEGGTHFIFTLHDEALKMIDDEKHVPLIVKELRKKKACNERKTSGK